MNLNIVITRSWRVLWFYTSLLFLCIVLLFYMDFRLKSGVELYRPGAYLFGRYVMFFVSLGILPKILVGFKQVITKKPIILITNDGLTIYKSWGGKNIVFPLNKIKKLNIQKSFMGDKIEVELFNSIFRSNIKRVYEVDFSINDLKELKGMNIPVVLKTN